MSETIVLERTLTASLDEVWSLWTSKEGFASWWGPEGFHVEVHRLEPRSGGHIVYDMIAHGSEQIAAMEAAGQPTKIRQQMRFSEVTPRTGLVITSVIDFAGVDSYESDLIL